MSVWMMWVAVTGLVVMLELFTGTFYLLMVALGMMAGALVAFFGISLEWQMIVAALVGAFATLALHKSKYGWREAKNASRDPNVNMDIGQSIHVQQWQDHGNGIYTSRAMYRGAMWDLELRHSAAVPGNFVIEAVEGSRLIVRPL
ncbi:NfeD family protein [Undibacterium piscinae]|jgi:membrane protein implicated in regulation of membrane protease activity|uniref:NfeD family protein n=1 Tax=Undibacterium piscinae TaxID=2495591 RepID=A0A6M4A030_9BURK|nr:NfeD family protein [Undibacterium piscinae]